MVENEPFWKGGGDVSGLRRDVDAIASEGGVGAMKSVALVRNGERRRKGYR